MRFVTVGDIHFKLNNEEDTEQLSTFLHQLLDASELNESIKKIDAIVLLGDILHTHERLHTMVMNRAIKLFTSLSKRRPLYILVGNHDYINNSQCTTEHHWMNALKTYPNITIVDKFVTISEELGVYAVPYVPKGMLASVIHGVTIQCLFAHQEIHGCKLGAIVSEDGDPWTSEGMIISGHIHESQWVGSNVYYTGSALQHSLAETAKKHIAIVTVGATPQTKVSIEEIIVPILLRHIYTYHTEIPVQIDHITYRDKVVFHGTKEDYKKCKQTKTYKTLHKNNIPIVWKETISTILRSETVSSLADKMIERIQRTQPPLRTKLFQLYNECVLGLRDDGKVFQSFEE